MNRSRHNLRTLLAPAAFAAAAGLALLSAAPGFAADEDGGETSMLVQDRTLRQTMPHEGESMPADVWERIRRGFAMPPCENAKVQKWLDYYSRRPDYLNRMFDRSGQYLYNILEELEARNMPTELALLPFVESAFQPEALSAAKAAGLWQFIPSTGRNYSLQQNLWRDERRDVLESTRAALDYFEYLHSMFNDWQLALAAYNWGEGSVQRAVRRAQNAGRPADYEHLRMPSETANYVPKLEAIKRIVSEPEKYGVTLPDVGNEPFFVTVTKPRDIDVKTAAMLAGMSLRDFKALNPSYKLPVIVAAHNNVMLLPADRVDEFIDNLASWMDSGQPLSRWTTHRVQEGESLADIAAQAEMSEEDLRDLNGIPNGRKVLPNSVLLVRATGESEDISEEAADAKLQLSPQTTWRRVVYRVRRGDTVPSIARRWHITPKSIVSANRLRNGRLRRGQRLILTVPNRTRAPIQQASASRTQAQPAAKNRIYAVAPGETLFSISQKTGVSVSVLKSTNRLRGNTIHAGQRLRIPVSGKADADDSAQAGKTAPQQAARSAADQDRGTTYTVRRGDTLYAVAKRFGVSASQIKRANGLKSNRVHAGQTLSIPAGRSAPAASSGGPKRTPQPIYTVRRGDTLSEIADRFDTTPAAIRKLNRLRGNSLKVGQKLRLP
ncbi:MAG: Lytic transglycosylase [Burkholderia sp.]|jgi:membrane-bound lytic murein transglycosylase D